MKKILVGILLISITACYSKEQKIPKQGTIMPSLTFQLLDTSKVFNTKDLKKGSPIVFVYFRTDCDHCRKETKDILANMESFKNVQFFFLTPMSIDDLNFYNNQFHLSKYPNFTIGRDYKMAFYQYYKPSNVPFIVIYNKEKLLHKIIVGDISINELKKFIHI